MKLNYNKKRVELSEVCKNVNEFIELLDEKISIKKYVNLSNPTIKNKMTDFFNFYLKKEGIINFSDKLKKDINTFFGFQLTGNKCYSFSALYERGFSEQEARTIINNIRKNYSEKTKKLREELFEQKKEYEFGKIKYHAEIEPVCNLCGSKLILRWTGHGAKKIIGCSNEYCAGYHQNPLSKNKVFALVPEKLYNEYIKRLTESRIINIEYWLKRGYTEKEAIQKISEIQRSNSSFLTPDKRFRVSKKIMTNKLGENECEVFFKERSQLCVEYWLKRGYTENEAAQKISEIQHTNAKKVKNHGVTKHIEYWINKGYCEEEAIEKLAESQRTFTKEKNIEKYGEIEGLKRWEERQNKWQKTLHESQNLHVGFSKISQELFNAIDKQLGENDYTFYGSKNHEYCIRKNSTNYIYDFTDLEHNKIIEFQGDIYHGNPELFTENEHPNPYHKDKSCKDLWEFDKKKGEIAVEHGFKILHIWEKDYRENKQKIIDKCINFILND